MATPSVQWTAVVEKLSAQAQAVLSDVAWALLCKANAWCNAIAELGPRAISNLCDGFDRIHVAGFTRGALEARMRAAADDAVSSLNVTFVLSEAMCVATRLDTVIHSARERSFTAFRVPIAGGADQLDRDVARVATVRALVGDNCTIEVDAHGNLSPARAAEAVQRLAASAKIARVLRPFAAVDVDEHRTLQEALNVANCSVVICPGACAAPLVAKQYVVAAPIRELAVEWRDSTTLGTLFTTLGLCAMSGKPVRLLAESQLESLVMLQLAAFASRAFGANSVSLSLCDEDASHRFQNVPVVRNGAVDLPTAPGVSGGLTTQALVEFDVSKQFAVESGTGSTKRARVDEAVAAVSYDDASNAYAEKYAAMSGRMSQNVAAYNYSAMAAASSAYGSGQVAVVSAAPPPTSSRAASMQCFVCKQTGHVVKDCPVAQANGRTDMCFQCGQPGHWASSCPRRLPKGVCYNCGDAGHMAPSCPQRPANVASMPHGHIRCYSCQQYGHTANNCPARRAQY